MLNILFCKPFLSLNASAQRDASSTISIPKLLPHFFASIAVSIPPPLYKSSATQPSSASSSTLAYNFSRTSSFTCKKVFAPALYLMPQSSASKPPCPRHMRHLSEKSALVRELFIFTKKVKLSKFFSSSTISGTTSKSFATTSANMYAPFISRTTILRSIPLPVCSS